MILQNEGASGGVKIQSEPGRECFTWKYCIETVATFLIDIFRKDRVECCTEISSNGMTIPNLRHAV